ncbi:MAG TPA: M48 family metalloprotease [Acidobacteriaceae bacterium]|jgi:Zn-dependent protease with chaperone function
MLKKSRLQFSGILLLLIVLCARTQEARASETPAEHAANVYAAQELAAAPPHGNLPDYSLPPDKLAKAQHLDTIRTVTSFGGTIWDILQLALLLWLGVIAWIRDRAVEAAARLRARGKRIRAFCRECVVFTGLFTVVTELLNLPLGLYRHHLAVDYGFSIQSWASWWSDTGKSFAIALGITLFLAALLKLLIRLLPRAWWAVCWAIVTPLVIFATYLAPLVLDPLYNKFEPLQQSHPELVAQLEKVVAKGHMDIPPERMFLMEASAKVTTINAYVTGFGSSKRVVVWDTSLQKGKPDQLLFIFGHESGHYVLGHVRNGLVLVILGLLVAFFLGYHLIRWAIRRYGGDWRIPSQSDWGAIAVLFFAFTIFEVVSQPIENSISRIVEHNADVYGQEAIHGLVANPQETAQTSFDVLGESVLDRPNPNLFVEFWLDSHPAIGRRAAFAHAYDPWAPGMEPKYFSKADSE